MDRLLLQRARNGDPSAVEQLLTPVEGLVWRVCWHYTGNRTDAEDCAQEAMLKLWRSLKDYREACSFESWCYRIAANVCLDFLRKRKNNKAESLEPLQEQGYDPPDPGLSPEETVVQSELRSEIREAILDLPPDQRDALVLTQLENKDYSEAALILGVSEGTVKSRVNRAREKLRNKLSDRNSGPPSGG